MFQNLSEHPLGTGSFDPYRISYGLYRWSSGLVEDGGLDVSAESIDLVKCGYGLVEGFGAMVTF